MEVQDRAVLPARSLSARPAAVRAWAAPALALAAVLATAVALVAAQPLASPWWTYADADATYTAAALNLVGGDRASFVDHPGLPLTELTALVLAVDAFANGAVTTADRRAYADERLLDLDASRWAFRGLAAALYLAGAVLSFALALRAFGHWAAGLAGGLLWAGAPGLWPMSVQLRPDVLLGVCCVAFAYLLGRALDERSGRSYAAAAAVAGLALTVKLHAAGLVVPLALAALWRPPIRAWRPDRRWLAPGAAFAAVAVLVNLERLPYTPTFAQAVAGAVAVALLAGAWALAGRMPAAGVAGAYLAGALVPVALAVPDGLQALVLLGKSALGRGVSDVPAFGTPLGSGLSLGGTAVVLVLLLGAGAAALGLVRRDPRPVVWIAGAAALLALAWARPVAVHYLAPAYLLAVPAVLWLARALGPRGTLLALPLAAAAVWAPLHDRGDPATEADRLRARGADAREAAVAELGPREVAVAPSYFPDPDVRYFELVELYVSRSPAYPYRVLPATERAAAFARERGLEPTTSIEGATFP